jgi:uncharacterized protein (DUF1810 family)
MFDTTKISAEINDIAYSKCREIFGEIDEKKISSKFFLKEGEENNFLQKTSLFHFFYNQIKVTTVVLVVNFADYTYKIGVIDDDSN